MADPGGEGASLRLVGSQTTSQPSDPLIGKVVDGRYRFESVLGEGGMGIVYRATHIALNKPLAIKVLRPEVSKNEEIVARFRQEAQSASAIGNQHIIDISDFGLMPDGATYFVMEFLEGQSLTTAIEGGDFGTQRIVAVAKQLCSALGAAHEVGIVHRDMKPDNVQLIPRGGTDDFVKVLDFGIAKVGGSTSKLTQAGQVFGTPHYMAPEQCAGAQVDARTDVYAVGIILYEMATGNVPFDADNLMGILTKHLYENPVPPHELPPPVDVAPALEAVIMKAIAKKPEQRYQSMAELSADLDAVGSGATPRAVVDQVDRQSQTTDHDLMSLDEAPGRVTLDVGQPTIPTRSRWPWILGLLALVAAVGAVFALGGEDGEGGGLTGAAGEAALVEEPEPVAEGAQPAIPDPAAVPVPEEPADPTAAEPAGPVEPAAVLEPSVPVEPTTPTEPPAAAVPSVSLTSVPSGAEVFQGNARLGVTPLSVPKPARGTATLVLRRSGYRDKSVRLRKSSGSSLKVRLLRRRTVSPANPKPTTTSQEPAPSAVPTPPAEPSPKPEPKPKPKPKPPSGRLQSEVLDPWQ